MLSNLREKGITTLRISINIKDKRRLINIEYFIIHSVIETYSEMIYVILRTQEIMTLFKL